MNHFKTIVSTIMVSTTFILASFIVIGDTFYDVPKSAIAQRTS